MPKERIKEFLNNERALVVEPSPPFLSLIANCLVDMGMPVTQISSAKTYVEAEKFLEKFKPRILITELDVGKNSGLQLCEIQEGYCDELTRIAIIVSKNSADSSVAETAEARVDAYMVKPFSINNCRERVAEAVLKKMTPGVYLQELKKGKDALKEKNMDAAIQSFKKAKGLTPKPALACSLLAQCYIAGNDMEAAKKEYAEGRAHSPLHYRCLTGEFDCLLLEKKYTDAYKMVAIIRDNFPITPERLQQFTIAAIYSSQFQDIQYFHKLYLALDNRTPKLTQMLALALLTAGRYYLRNPSKAESAELWSNCFEMGLSITGKSIDFLDKIIDELLLQGEIATAEKFLKNITADEIGSAKAEVLKFKVYRHLQPPEVLLETGRRIVMDGNGTPEVIRVIVQMMVKCGKQTLAETIIIRALEKFPDMKSELYSMVE